MEFSDRRRGFGIYGAIMTRVEFLNCRYDASAALVSRGVEIFAVGDLVGARFNVAARRLIVAAQEDGPDLWDDLVGAVKVLRWRLVTHPQPIALNLALSEGAEEVRRQIWRLRGAVVNKALLDELAEAASEVGASDPILGDVLLRSIEEVGHSACVVVAASTAACAALDEWLRDEGVRVLTAGDLGRTRPDADQSYVLGPPRFFHSSIVTAPVTSEVTFLMPAWFADQQIPRSTISAYAEDPIHIEPRVFNVGEVGEPEPPMAENSVVEDEFLPQPVWDVRESADREPTSDEVAARKILLSGGLALWLDDGERIRAVDPRQPLGERVAYVDVPAVRVGTYLLIRHGETERQVLYEAALSRLGSHGAAVDASQREWKQRLQERLRQHGYRAVSRALRDEGVQTTDRARAWTEPNLIRPHDDHDFQRLLTWLDLSTEPYFGNATSLRRAIYQASAEIREQLEALVSAADLSLLERDGNLSLEVKKVGFRGVLATRILAISPRTEIVVRHDARVSFEDRSGQWLE